MNHPKVKMCGLTSLEDTKKAIELGADYVGFIFYKKSPRYVEPEAVKAITNHLLPSDSVQTVGVFVNEDEAFIHSIMHECKLDIIQLAGNESPSLLTQLDFPTWKTIHVDIEEHDIATSINATREEIQRFSAADAILLDTFYNQQYGGTGKTFDHSIYTSVTSAHPYILLSGGISPENVADICTTFNPYCIDLSSGVESSPGNKDHQKMTTLFQIINALK